MIPGYRDFRLIGQGGFSTVYTALQESFDRRVAVKVITVELSEDTLRRFRRELATVGRLDGHPHVIRVYESGFTEEGHPYLTMEYHEGGSLADRVEREGPLPVTEVLDIGVKLASALAAAHERDVLHRDVKPQNVLLSAFHGPVLADFGIAMFDSSRMRTLTGEAFSALHVAPEVLDGHPPTQSADVYSLASTLYELLAGAAPFAPQNGAAGTEDGLLAVMRRVRTQAVPPIERDDIPPRLRDELSTLLARVPADRPASGDALADRLREVQVDLGIAPTPSVARAPASGPAAENPVDTTPPPSTPTVGPRPPGSPTPETKPSRGRLRRWQLAVALAAVTGLGITATLWPGRDGNSSTGDRAGSTTTTAASSTTAVPTETTATASTPTCTDPGCAPGVSPAAAAEALETAPTPADGRDDLVYVEAEGPAAFFPNVDGAWNRWGPRTVIGEGWHPTRVHLADLDGDGRDDRVYVGVDGTAHFFANIAAASNRWGPDRVVGQGWDPAHVQFADLDGDGKDDWLYLGEDAVMRYHQNVDGPAGDWGPAKEVSFGWDATRIKFADVDGDGKDDQIAVWGGGDASFWVNVDLPNKVQGPEQPLGTGWDPARVQFADLDGDGRDDLVEVTAEGVTRFHANRDGTGSWGPAVDLGTSWDPARLRFADLA